MNYDVVILGGGPAGTAAAITLSKAGISTILVEKYFHPREKTCAGILTQKTISFITQNFSFPIMQQTYTSNRVSITYQRNNMVQFETQFPFVFVDRQTFDSELLNICQEKGTNIIEGVIATKIYPNENKILLSNDQTLTYKCLIAADGVFSPTRKQLGLPNLPISFCIQDTVKRHLCPDSLKHLEEVQLNFGDVPLGYSWIVPYQEYIAIGTGIFTEKLDYPILLSKHTALCKHIGFPALAKRRGAFVPIGGFDNQTKHPYKNIIFIGDSAGLANPLTGEGIYHALLSGFYAGKAYLMNTQNIRATYLSLLNPIINQLAQQKNLSSQFYNQTLLGNFLFQSKDCPEYLSEICDEVISLETKSYQSLIVEIQQLLR